MKNVPAYLGGKPTREKFLLFGSPQILDEDIQEVVDTLKSGWLSTGPKVQKFEEMFREYIGSKYAIALNSCTAGIHLALQAVGIKRGDEVITTPLTFASTANATLHCGAKPIFVDVEKETGNIDTEKIKKAITKKTRVILPVHLYGRPCRMEEIQDIAKKHALFIIEDAAHCIEGKYKDKKIGNVGDITTFSFYATKNLTTGEGGMLTTNNDKWAEEIRIKSLHGISKHAFKRYSEESYQHYEVIYPGYKYNMMDIQAAIGIHQLKRIEKNLKIREKYWKRYNNAFCRMEEIIIPKEEKDITHARHLYTILIKPELLKITRDDFLMLLTKENIGSGVHFTALHLHAFYKKKFGYKRGNFPNAEFISDRTISLPLSAGLREEDVENVISAIMKILNYYSLFSKFRKSS